MHSQLRHIVIIPAYFAFANRFTLCDNYYSEVAGPSTPNHLMLICATAPIINTIFITWDDWGGWFDRVVPRVKEAWQHTLAQRAADAFPQFDGQPFRMSDCFDFAQQPLARP